MVKRKHIEHGEKKIVFFPKQNKKEKEKAHTGRLQSFVFLCASPKGLSGEIQKEKREENPTKTEENGVCIVVVVVVSSPEDKAREKKTRERKKKTKQNQEHQTHIQNGMRNEEENIFFGFLNRYKKVDDTRKSGTHTHTRIHTKRLVVFFLYIFLFMGSFQERQELQINKQRKTNNSRQ